MSNDLISRRSIIEKLENVLLDGDLTIGEKGLLSDIVSFVAIETTAYDIDKVVEELEEKKQNALEVEGSIKEYNVWNDAIEIVQKVAEEYNNGWIPCSERLPEKRDWCLAVFEEVDTGFIGLPYIAEYLMGKHTIATTEDGWIIHNCTDREDVSSEYYKKLRCVAWQPLPEPYKERD